MRIAVGARIAGGVLATLLLWGCAHPAEWVGPNFHIPREIAGPGAVVGYDTNGDGRTDYVQVCNADGVKRRLAFDADHDGRFEVQVDLDAASGDNPGDARYLFVLLDGVSYQLVADLYAEGHFRLFHPPGRIIPGFPTVTDNVYADFFETPRPLGYEALYLDRETNRLAGGSRAYLTGANEPVWPRHMLYRQNYLFDAISYVLTDWVAVRELDKSIGRAIRWYEASDGRYAAIYIVTTDAIGHDKGRGALRDYLLRVDRAIEQMVWRSRGRLRVLCMADHGLNAERMQRCRLDDGLTKAGFRPAESLKTDRDVVVPKYGLVSYAAVHTRNAEEAARAIVGIEGVDLAIRPEDGAFAVAGREGEARVETAAGGRYRYVAQTGDPLMLLGIVERLKSGGQADAEGWASAGAWFEATWDHVFPDPLARIAAAFEGNVRNPADVLVSLGPQYYHGKPGFDAFATLRGTHGSLRECATTTFVLSNFFVPRHHQRLADLRDQLKKLMGRDTLLPDGDGR